MELPEQRGIEIGRNALHHIFQVALQERHLGFAQVSFPRFGGRFDYAA